MAPSVGPSSLLSCTLAPLPTSDSGMPRASTSRLLLGPFFSPIGGVRSHTFSGQRSFAHGPVYALPLPGDSLHFIVFGQPGPPYLEEETVPLPTLKIGMNRTSAAILPGQGLPLAAGAKHIDYGRENLPRRQRLAAPSRLALILPSPLPLRLRDQRLNLGPPCVRYRPRLYLCHLELYLHPASLPLNTKIRAPNLFDYYLRPTAVRFDLGLLSANPFLS